MKKLIYLAIIACTALFASCEKEGVTHTGDETGNLYGIWALTTKTTITKASDGSATTQETDYTSNHFYLALSEFPFPHAIAKKGSFTDLDLDDVDVKAAQFTYNSEESKITFKKLLSLTDDVLTRNMTLYGTFEVLKLTENEFVIQQTVKEFITDKDVTTVYSYRKQK